MNIDDLVTQYLAFCQALGEKGRDKEYLLRPFCRAIGPRTNVARIQTEAVSAFLGEGRPVTMAWHNKYRALKGLFRFAVTHLLRASVDINTIRTWLGHVSLATTNVYAEVDMEMKAKALANCEVGTPKKCKPWKEDAELMAFLQSL